MSKKTVTVRVLSPIGGRYGDQPVPGIGETFEMHPDHVAAYARYGALEVVEVPEDRKPATEAPEASQAPSETPEAKVPAKSTRRRKPNAAKETE